MALRSSDWPAPRLDRYGVWSAVCPVPAPYQALYSMAFDGKDGCGVVR